MRFRLSVASWILVLAAVAVSQEVPVGAPLEFKVGQRWSYQTRPEDPKSTIVIGKIEDLPELGRAVHISVLEVNIKNPRAPGGVTHVVHHMPISEAALRGSVIREAGVGTPAPQFEGGYQTWRAAMEKGEAGIFSVSVREAVGNFESIVNAPN
jgi:hypothetical protein